MKDFLEFYNFFPYVAMYEKTPMNTVHGIQYLTTICEALKKPFDSLQAFLICEAVDHCKWFSVYLKQRAHQHGSPCCCLFFTKGCFQSEQPIRCKHADSGAQVQNSISFCQTFVWYDEAFVVPSSCVFSHHAALV